MSERVKVDASARKTFWQPPEQRDHISEESRQWNEEDEAAAKSWRDWIEKNGLPLAKYRPF